MEQKTKFVIIGLAGFCLLCFLLFIQAQGSKQALSRERDDLRKENTVLNSKIESLEVELKSNQGKISSLQGELEKLGQKRDELQAKYEGAAKARDELADKLRSQSMRQKAALQQQQEALPANTDAYWASVLKAKTDLEIQLGNIRNELRTLQINNEGLQRDKSSLGMELNSLRNEKQDLLRQLDYNQKLLDSLAQEVVREKNDKSKLQEGFRSLKNENLAVSRQLQGLSSRKITLDKRVQDLQEANSAMEKRLAEMETMLSEKVSQIEILKEKFEALKSGRPVSGVKKNGDAVELPAIVVRSTAADEKKEGPAGVFPGKVLAVNPENKFVIINLGSDSGVDVGDNFNVYRGTDNIGAIEVIQTRKDISACDIKRESMAFNIGDGIK